MIKDGYYRGLEQEFVRPDGTLNFYRSARTGIGLNGASFSTDLRPMPPHLADRGWALLRAAFEERDGELVTPLADREQLLDTGNYCSTRSSPTPTSSRRRARPVTRRPRGRLEGGPAADRHEDRRAGLARG